MGIPDALVSTAWGWLLVLLALLLTQAKPFLDWMIWRKSQNAIDSMLAELSKAVELRAKLDPESQSTENIQHFIDVNLKVLKNYGEVRAIKDGRRISRAHKRLNPGRKRKIVAYSISIVTVLVTLILGAVIMHNYVRETLGIDVPLPMFILMFVAMTALMVTNIVFGEDGYGFENRKRNHK